MQPRVHSVMFGAAGPGASLIINGKKYTGESTAEITARGIEVDGKVVDTIGTGPAKVVTGGKAFAGKVIDFDSDGIMVDGKLVKGKGPTIVLPGGKRLTGKDSVEFSSVSGFKVDGKPVSMDFDDSQTVGTQMSTTVGVKRPAPSAPVPIPPPKRASPAPPSTEEKKNKSWKEDPRAFVKRLIDASYHGAMFSLDEWKQIPPEVQLELLQSAIGFSHETVAAYSNSVKSAMMSLNPKDSGMPRGKAALLNSTIDALGFLEDTLEFDTLDNWLVVPLNKARP